MSSLFVNCASVAAGALSHLLYFRHGEHHMRGWHYIRLFLLAVLASVAAVHYTSHASPSQAFTIVKIPTLLYLAGLYTSLVVYRIYFHPLKNFPGPTLAAVACLFYSGSVYHGKAYWQLEKLHAKYGPFVRTGSSELSIAHPDAVEAVHGTNSLCTKMAGYDGDQPAVSLHSTRDRALHDRRRRIWAPAFSDRALRGYEDRVRIFANELATKFVAHEGQPLNVTQWFGFFAFDVMGDLAFGRDFDMLKDGGPHWAVNCLSEGLAAFRFAPPPWILRLAISIPGLAKAYWRFIGYCNERLDTRIAAKGEKTDIMDALLKPHESTPMSKQDLLFLQGDARLIIVAGSDTTSSTLTFLFYHLAKHQEVQARLRAELAPLFKQYPDGDIKATELQGLEYLNGCINEALRLFPPLPSSVARLVPPEGIRVGETWIPGNMNVVVPQWVLGRDPKIYPSPHAFLPERWSPANPHLLTSKAAFAPFSIGPYGCIGKNLALMEIRMLTAKLMAVYGAVELAPGETGEKLIGDMYERITIDPGELKLVFRKL